MLSVLLADPLLAMVPIFLFFLAVFFFFFNWISLLLRGQVDVYFFFGRFFYFSFFHLLVHIFGEGSFLIYTRNYTRYTKDDKQSNFTQKPASTSIVSRDQKTMITTTPVPEKTARVRWRAIGDTHRVAVWQVQVGNTGHKSISSLPDSEL